MHYHGFVSLCSSRLCHGWTRVVAQVQEEEEPQMTLRPALIAAVVVSSLLIVGCGTCHRGTVTATEDPFAIVPTPAEGEIKAYITSMDETEHNILLLIQLLRHNQLARDSLVERCFTPLGQEKIKRDDYVSAPDWDAYLKERQAFLEQLTRRTNEMKKNKQRIWEKATTHPNRSPEK